MACGLPILASHYTALQLLTLKHRVGICADPNSARGIARVLLEMETAIHAGAFSREAIRETFLRHFAFEHWEEAICGAFDSLLGQRRTVCSDPPEFGDLGAPLSAVPLNLIEE